MSNLSPLNLYCINVNKFTLHPNVNNGNSNIRKRILIKRRSTFSIICWSNLKTMKNSDKHFTAFFCGNTKKHKFQQNECFI